MALLLRTGRSGGLVYIRSVLVGRRRGSELTHVLALILTLWVILMLRFHIPRLGCNRGPLLGMTEATDEGSQRHWQARIIHYCLRSHSAAVFEDWLPSECQGCSGNQRSHQTSDWTSTCLLRGAHDKLTTAQWNSEVLGLVGVVVLGPLSLIPSLDNVLVDIHSPLLREESFHLWYINIYKSDTNTDLDNSVFLCILSNCYDHTDH